MKLIERYVLRELIPIFALGNFLILLLLLLDKVVSLAELFFGRDVSGTLILQTFVYYLPSFMVIGIPAAALLAAIVGFSRLSGDSEIIAMRAAGAGGMRLLRPTLVFGMLCLLLSLSITTWLMPIGNSRALENLHAMVRTVSLKDLQPNQLYREIPGLVIYVEKKDSDTEYENVILIQRSKRITVTAERGIITPATGEPAVNIELFNGRLVNAAETQGNFRAINFSRFNLDFAIPVGGEFAALDQRSYSIGRLWNEMDTSPLMRFEFHKRLSLPVSAFIMPLFGLALGLQFARSGRSMGAFMAFFFVFAYNVMFFFAENMAIAGNIHPVLGAWAPDGIFALLATMLLPRVFR